MRPEHIDAFNSFVNYDFISTIYVTGASISRSCSVYVYCAYSRNKTGYRGIVFNCFSLEEAHSIVDKIKQHKLSKEQRAEHLLYTIELNRYLRNSSG